MTIDPINGGCLCGACRYTSTGEILKIRSCHCHRCQKATGAAFYARIMVQLDSVTMSGPVGWFGTEAGVRRGFCESCGTSLFSERQSANTIGLSMGSLDTPDRYAPQEHIWVSAKQKWLRFTDGKPQFAQGPPT